MQKLTATAVKQAKPESKPYNIVGRWWSLPLSKASMVSTGDIITGLQINEKL